MLEERQLNSLCDSNPNNNDNNNDVPFLSFRDDGERERERERDRQRVSLLDFPRKWRSTFSTTLTCRPTSVRKSVVAFLFMLDFIVTPMTHQPRYVPVGSRRSRRGGDVHAYSPTSRSN